MIILLIIVFYFFLIRPQQKRQKEAQKFRDSLAKGARVITYGGVHGRIAEVGEKTVMLEVAPGVKVKVEKAMLYASADDAQADAANKPDAEQK